ncbi:winged helix-turn-helix transcriptional regulator [Actinomyces bowdenii]|uniref:ArsR/SmtB family transcription factor n=1 Tax=Actinomyces bowdenii TaxID=131109 RepID=UPI001ABD3F83|nr:metalloregulator ArsR/SmtB family transcription factor [Actinomyces bowdenii]MBO3725840.1 winged helix-turn-helix transcriptional regulator [Actinomyces bowdenii]
MAKHHGLSPSDLTNDASAVRDSADPAFLLSTLGDPTRLAIVAHLRGGEHRVGELAAHLGLAQSTVSQHLAVLREAGIISTHSHGRARVSALEHRPQLDALLRAARDLARAARPAARAADQEQKAGWEQP